MVFHMKTTLVIEDAVMRRLKALAADRGVTLSAIVEDFLRRGLREASRVAEEVAQLAPLPSFSMGKPRVDLSDREALDAATRESAPTRPATAREERHRVRR